MFNLINDKVTCFYFKLLNYVQLPMNTLKTIQNKHAYYADNKNIL